MAMNKPRLDEVMDQFDSKYTLVIVAAKRARQLTVNAASELHEKHLNPVSVALGEIAKHEIAYLKSAE